MRKSKKRGVRVSTRQASSNNEAHKKSVWKRVKLAAGGLRRGIRLPSFGKTPEKEKLDSFQVSITPEFDVTPNYALVNGVYHRIVKAVGYPRRVEDGWLEAFLFASEPYDISLHVEPSSINSTLVMLHNQIIRQTSDLVSSTSKGQPNPALEIKRTDTMKVYESLYKGEEKLFGVSFYVDNQAKTLQELALLTEKCKANLNAMLIIPKTVDYRMAAGFKCMLPQAFDALEARREFMTSSLSATFPFLYPVDSAKTGLFFAHERNTLNPIFIDFDSMSNKHFFVLGISGSGKSYTSKFLIMQHLLANQSKVFILDPNGEYKSLAAQMNGEVIELSKDSDSIINLFDLAGEDYSSKMLTLISVFDIITGGLTESQKGVLNAALVEVYKDKGIESHKPDTWKKPAPTFSDLKVVLERFWQRIERRVSTTEEKSVEVLLNRVRMYSKSGFFGFLDKGTRVNLRNDFIDFDLSALPVQVKQLVMFSVLELVAREIKRDKNPKVVLIDEGWSLLRSKEAENYVLDFIKTSRKHNASIGFITQEIEDLLRSDGGKSILNTTSTKVLLRQNSSNLNLICKTLALNEKERDYLLRAERGQGLLITEKGRYEFAVNASPKIHGLITTDPNEKQAQVVPEKIKSPKPKLEIKLDVNKGFYELKDVSEEEKMFLKQEGYVLYRGLGLQASGSYYFLVKTRGNETEEHALLCWMIADEIRKKGGTPVLNPTAGVDVFVEIKGKRIGFEVETGKILVRQGPDYIKKRLEERRKDCDRVLFVVTDRLLAGKYKTLTECDAFTRTEVKKVVEDLFA